MRDSNMLAALRHLTPVLLSLRHRLLSLGFGRLLAPFGAAAQDIGSIAYVDIASAALGHVVKTAMYEP